jgi:hypothetical protein
MNLSFYRFFFRQHDITVRAEVIECDGDASALEKAKELLSTSQFRLIEVWQTTRKVGIVERG